MKTNSSISKAVFRKIGLSSLLAVSAFVAFATLGDGKSKKETPRKSLLTNKANLKPGTFSLHSGYSFRGSQVINSQDARYVNLNTVITFQQGNTTYTMPMKGKISLNLNTDKSQTPGATVKVSF